MCAIFYLFEDPFTALVASSPSEVAPDSSESRMFVPLTSAIHALCQISYAHSFLKLPRKVQVSCEDTLRICPNPAYPKVVYFLVFED